MSTCMYAKTHMDTYVYAYIQDVWKEGLKQAALINYKYPRFAPTPLQKLMPHASQVGDSCVCACMYVCV